ncbi:transposase [Streptomyces sp. DH37]|uniref:transposase n=1 Tax=Streptomyces sp. DH37 TaxID=3040122 RepID=UPI002442974A|nr:transposase [Streptomyces sp. DH37]MDG9702563.1 transposase [Streptomyces sp. DH37]
MTLSVILEFPGATAMWVRDRLDGLWHDEDFAGWYPRDGRPGLSPARLATVCVLQFLLGLSDRQAAEAVRCRFSALQPEE